jgi:hypothetical protein
MAKNKDVVEFRDYFTIAKPTVEQTKIISDTLMSAPMNSYGSSNSQTQGRGLEVTMKATHSAFNNLNKRFYIPSRMADGAVTFMNKKKPTKILKHHDAESDPVGIIVGAEYVSTIPDALVLNRDVQILTDSSNSLSKQIQAAKRFMKSGIPFTDGWEGLGYIKLKAVIFDDKAINQISNGLFDSVSTSFSSPGEAYCSICGQNWAKDGFCEHEPGQVYKDSDEEEGIPCSLIPGVHNYSECSLVTFDADPLTSVIIGHQDSLKTWSIPVEDWRSREVANSSEFVYEIRDFKEDTTMTDQTTVELTEQEKKVLLVVKAANPEMEDAVALELVKTVLAKKQEDGFYPNQEEACIDEETAIQYVLDDLGTAGQEINADDVYAEMEKELIGAELSDKVLSAESRNKMSESTFCGPQRSFPAPDCAHVTAARRLIGRYKGPGDKSSILACVSRKAKALGCDGSKDVQPVDATETTTDAKFELPACSCLQQLSAEDAQSLFAMAEAELITRNLKVQRECSKCAAQEDALKNTEVALKDSQVKVKDLEVTLKVLREELQRQYGDYAAQVDRFVDQGVQLRAAKEEKVAMISVLCGKHADMTTAWEAMRSVDLATTEAALNFKLEDAVAKLNDGMANKPVGTVKDPTVNPDGDNKKLPEGLSAPALAAIENIKDFLSEGQFANAQRLYDRMVNCKVLDITEVPFESLQQKVAE